ncbi:LOW QUALITY PROTEIN: olfactory receptor 13C9-like [Trichechus inunguis]
MSLTSYRQKRNSKMEWENQTVLLEFFLKGLSGYSRLELLFFVLTLIMYVFVLLGSGTLILISILDSHLHTPVYFFLGNLSFLDICYTTTSIPSTLVSFLSERTISFSGCAVQMFLGLAMGTTECVLLGVMGFDRYVSICNPLRYPIIMSKNSYVPMATGSWFAGIVNSAVQTVFVVQLPFCRNNVINCFSCEILAAMKLACADISGNEFTMLVVTTLLILMPLLLIVISYSLFISSILKVHSSERRSKAFSTCSAHLTVIIFYGTILFMYMKPKSKATLDSNDLDATDKLISMFYGVMTPRNPLIYSLRNKDVKEAVKRLLMKRFISK